VEPSLIAAVATVLASLIAGVFAWEAAKRKGAKDAQASLNEGYKILINQLQEERITIAAANRKTADTASADRKRLLDEIKGLRTEVHDLTLTVSALRRQLLFHDIKPEG
jgi:hypothetical protein